MKQLKIITQGSEVDLLIALLNANGALSISLQDAANEPLFQEQPEDIPLWKKIRVTALFSTDENIDHVLLSIKRDFPHIELSIEPIENQDWVSTTQQYFQPQHYGNRLWVLPSWHDEKNYSSPLLKLYPGLSFFIINIAASFLIFSSTLRLFRRVIEARFAVSKRYLGSIFLWHK